MDSVRIVGLTELRRDMSALGRSLPGEMQKTDLKAAELIAKAARNKAQNLGGVAHHVAPSIAAASTPTNAELTWGGDKYPMAAGAEFGAIRYHQFKPYLGSDENGGYFVMPAVRDSADQVLELYGAMIDDAF